MNNLDLNHFKIRKIFAPISVLLAPGYSGCYRCGVTWKFVESHTTKINKRGGMFPLCEYCWIELGTNKKRLPYYKMLWDVWLTMGEPNYSWEEIENSVMKENIEMPIIEHKMNDEFIIVKEKFNLSEYLFIISLSSYMISIYDMILHCQADKEEKKKMLIDIFVNTGRVIKKGLPNKHILMKKDFTRLIAQIKKI